MSSDPMMLWWCSKKKEIASEVSEGESRMQQQRKGRCVAGELMNRCLARVNERVRATHCCTHGW